MKKKKKKHLGLDQLQALSSKGQDWLCTGPREGGKQPFEGLRLFPSHSKRKRKGKNHGPASNGEKSMQHWNRGKGKKLGGLKKVMKSEAIMQKKKREK